jgi:hypothetical protein
MEFKMEKISWNDRERNESLNTVKEVKEHPNTIKREVQKDEVSSYWMSLKYATCISAL